MVILLSIVGPGLDLVCFYCTIKRNSDAFHHLWITRNRINQVCPLVLGGRISRTPGYPHHSLSCTENAQKDSLNSELGHTNILVFDYDLMINL